MTSDKWLADIETLAKMAARLAGRDPDEHLLLKLADVVAFDGVMWRYPDFISRAEVAYAALTSVGLTSVTEAHQDLSRRFGQCQLSTHSGH